MSASWFWGQRTKWIHSVGPVAKVKFLPATGQPFDGVFKGADYGLLRFSSAQQPNSEGGLSPGFGLKFLKDGVDSSNVVAIGSSSTWNYFGGDFSNWIGVRDDFAVNVLRWKFSFYTDTIFTMGTSEMRIDQQGNEGSNFPFKMRFVPHSDVTSLGFSSEFHGEMAYLDDIKSIPADSTLFDVYGETGPSQTGG